MAKRNYEAIGNEVWDDGCPMLTCINADHSQYFAARLMQAERMEEAIKNTLGNPRADAILERYAPGCLKELAATLTPPSPPAR